jgi:hypothetical protein
LRRFISNAAAEVAVEMSPAFRVGRRNALCAYCALRVLLGVFEFACFFRGISFCRFAKMPVCWPAPFRPGAGR